MSDTMRRRFQALALAAFVFAPVGLAQDEGLEPDAAGDQAAMPDEANTGQGAAAPVKASAAEPAHLAARSLLLGVTNSGRHLIAVGDRGNIVASNDGANWAQVEVPVRATLTAVEFVDEQHGWVVGHDATILHSRDGGRTWVLQNFQPELEKPFLDVLFTDARKGMAIGAYGLLMVTADGGATWVEQQAAAIRDEELHLNAVTQLGNGEFLVVGETGMMGVSADGSNWERLTAPYEGSLYGAIPRGDSGALIYGLRGNVFVSQDVRSGSWTKIDVGTVASFFGGALLPSGDVALVGLAGEVAVITPDGRVRNTKVEAVAGVTGSGTLSGAIPWKNGVLAVGELGVSRVGL